MESAPGPSRGGGGRLFNILYFAGASSYTGKEKESLPAPMPLDELFDELESRYPGIKAKVLCSCMVTINLDYAGVAGEGLEDGGVVIQEADEVAIIPPVSSG